MENNNLLEMEEIQSVQEGTNEELETNSELPTVYTYEDENESSDFMKNLLLIGAGALMATTPIVYSKVIKPRFKKLFGKKDDSEVEEDVEVEDTIEENNTEVTSNEKKKSNKK